MDFFNPIFIREMRQAVRNKTLLLLLNVYLVILLLTIYYELIWEPGRLYLGSAEGESLFHSLMSVIVPGTTLVTLFNTCVRSVYERVNEDPMYFANLTPSRLIRGRLMTVFVLSLMAYLIALPFLTLAYLLRGLDLQYMLLVLLATFWWVQVLNMIALAFTSGIRSYLGLGFYAFPFLLALVFFGLLDFGTVILLQHMKDDPIPLRILIVYPFLLGTALPLLAYQLAVGCLIPASEDRMFRTRLMLTITLPLLALLCGIDDILLPKLFPFLARITAPVLLFLFYFVGDLLFPILTLIFVCEREDYPERMRQALPKHEWLKILRFPLSSGAAAGLLWLALAIPFWFGAVSLIWYFRVRALGIPDDTIPVNTTVFAIYCFNYAVAVLVLYNRLSVLHRRIPRYSLWLVVLALVLLVCVLSYALQIYATPAGPLGEVEGEWNKCDATKYQYQYFLAFNPLTIFIDFERYRYIQIAVAGLWYAFSVVYLLFRCLLYDYQAYNEATGDTSPTPPNRPA